jgi:hypothetical protein
MKGFTLIGLKLHFDHSIDIDSAQMIRLLAQFMSFYAGVSRQHKVD